VLILLKLESFLKNNRGLSDLGRIRARSDGGELPVTWHAKEARAMGQILILKDSD
jgi:hypothetical protein